MQHIKEGKEFKLKKDGITYNVLITKVSKDAKGIIQSIRSITLGNTKLTDHFTLQDFINIEPSLTNTEIFKFHVNWVNFKRNGVHQDLNFADKLRKEIINTCNIRGFVTEGDGKLEKYDFILLKQILNNTI